MASTSPDRRPRIILDTNVVLDWMLFGDVNGRRVGHAITSGAVLWIATTAMRDEHFEVIARSSLAKWAPDARGLRTLWWDHCSLRIAPGKLPVQPGLQCADPDDQMFIDLAMAERPSSLLSRDKALLVLAAQAKRQGIVVTTPKRWVDAYEADAARNVD